MGRSLRTCPKFSSGHMCKFGPFLFFYRPGNGMSKIPKREPYEMTPSRMRMIAICIQSFRAWTSYFINTLLDEKKKLRKKPERREKESKTAAAFMHHSMPPCNVTVSGVDIVTGELERNGGIEGDDQTRERERDRYTATADSRLKMSALLFNEASVIKCPIPRHFTALRSSPHGSSFFGTTCP